MKSFFRSGLTKLTKNNSFNYQPRYYDERKERFQKREQEIKDMMSKEEVSSEGRTTEFNFRRSSSHGSHRSKEMTRANIRLILIMLILLGICYALFMNMEAFSNLFQR
jgi:uncharacterized membrane protein YgaE (UPF0421/DUF939 family)